MRDFTFIDAIHNDFRKDNSMSAAEIEDAEYRRYGAALGIEPIAQVPQEGQRLVQMDAAEVAELRRWAAYGARAHTSDEDAFYERHRAMILGTGR